MALHWRPFSLPALGIGIACAIGFFRVYGYFTRPEVPRPIAATVEHYAPGVAIGTSVRRSTKRLTGMRYVRYVGFVGTLPRNNDGFGQVRLLLSPTDRAKPIGDEDARVDAVEVVGNSGSDQAMVMTDLAMLFRGMPKDGCIAPATEETPYRRVQYWTTANNRGGVALITDWITPGNPGAGNGVAVWSLLAWSGAFDGSKTLRAGFDPRSCQAVTGS
ncbi:MAG: hypothetical protein JWO05_1352 [Gemmatimonadetes bacterium]|nr:hypothetical protein [Gemmatimonadota bacterium]